MDTGDIIALGSLLVALIVMGMSARRDTRGSQASQTEIKTRLEIIAGGVEDIRIEQRTIADRMSRMGERLAAVEASCKSAHHRLDMVQQGGASAGSGAQGGSMSSRGGDSL